MMKIYSTYATAAALTRKDFEWVLENPPADAVWYSPGGQDIDPALYGEENTHSFVCTPGIDRREFELVKRILLAGLPLFGVCRGHQLIAAAAGGSLFQDIYADGGLLKDHHHSSVLVACNSRLANIIGGGQITFEATTSIIPANSLHHQAVCNVPEGWSAVAWSPDGIIEAIEHPSLPVVSVQWHPEFGLRDQYRNILSYLWAEVEHGSDDNVQDS